MSATLAIWSRPQSSSIVSNRRTGSYADKGRKPPSPCTITRWRLFLTIGILFWLLWVIVSAIASTTVLDGAGMAIDSSHSRLRRQSHIAKRNRSQNEASSLRFPTYSQPYLLVIIPTMPRTKSTNYLTQTITAIKNELLYIHDAQRNRVHVHVVNSRPGMNHSEFYELKLQFHNNTQFTFLETDGLDGTDPGNYTEEPVIDKGPGLNVRRQTRDLVKVMRLSMHTMKTSQNHGADGQIPEHAVVWEDDFKPCSKAFPTLLDVISRLYDPLRPNKGDWFALRTSYGFNGVVQRGRDVLDFCNYLLKHQHRRPPDHLLVEWFASETDEARFFRGDRYHATFYWHVYEHQGNVSSLREEEKSKKLPGCWQPYNRTLFEVESFLPFCKRKGEDITPCPEGVRRANYEYPDMSKLTKVSQIAIKRYQGSTKSVSKLSTQAKCCLT